MKETANIIEPTKQAKQAQELRDKMPDHVKEAVQAMERTMRMRRLVIAEPRRYRYREIF